MPTKNEFLELPKNVWTIAKKWKPGDTATGSYHRIEIEEIIEERDCYNLARVKVLNEIKGACGSDRGVNNPIPPLTFHGEEYGPADW